MKLYEIREFSEILHAATQADPFLALCGAVAWLDPLAGTEEPFLDEDAYFNGGDSWSEIGLGWEISRGCFPEVYAETTLALRGQPEPRQLADQLCTGINAHLVGGELYDLEQLYFGVPFFGRGIDLSDTDFFTEPPYDDLITVYELLGVSFASGHPDGSYEAARAAHILASSLCLTESDTHTDIACLLDWMFGQTGNTVCDMSETEFHESGFQPMEWTPDNIEFNNLMHAEAAEIIGQALRGLALFKGDPAWREALQRNFQSVSRRLNKEKSHDNRHDASELGRGLGWPDRAGQPHEQRPGDDAQDIQIRGADAA